MSIKVIRYRLPSYWACPLINDDYTGLTDEECEEIQRFLEAAEGYPVDVDLETQGFYRCNDAGTLPGECEEVPIWTSVCGEDKSKYVRLATEEEKKSFAERIANTENLKKAGIIKQYLSEYEYLLTKEKKCDFKPFDQVLVRASNLGNWNLHLFARVREEEYKYECLGGLRYKECIPYQGNEHLLGTNKSK